MKSPDSVAVGFWSPIITSRGFLFYWLFFLVNGLGDERRIWINSIRFILARGNLSILFLRLIFIPLRFSLEYLLACRLSLSYSNSVSRLLRNVIEVMIYYHRRIINDPDSCTSAA